MVSEISDYIGEALRDTKDGYVRGILSSPSLRIYPVTQRSFSRRDKTGRDSSSENQGQSVEQGEK